MKPAGPAKSEKQVAAPLVTWLEHHDWEVHQEVQMQTGGPRADIVARMGRLIWIVEVKRSLSLSLLDQVAQWHGYGNYVSAAAWQARPCFFLERYLGYLGIGLFRVDYGGVGQIIGPKLVRQRSDQLARCLCEETRTWAKAGATCQDEWFTPYRRTCRAVLQAVSQDPGITTKQVMERITHHYENEQSARSSLLQWVRAGKVPGVRVERPTGSKSALWYPEKVSA